MIIRLTEKIAHLAIMDDVDMSFPDLLSSEHGRAVRMKDTMFDSFTGFIIEEVNVFET